MKKATLTVITILILTLTACSGASNSSQTFSGQQNNASASGLPTASKLLVGSFKLEKTGLAITQKQAVDLLPLWQVYKDLSSSDTAAQEEIDALTEQIQETMTPEQMNAINGMNLTQRDIFTLMQEQGIQFAGSAQQGNQSNNSQNNSNQNNRRSGGGNFQGGGPVFQGGPGGGFGGGQGLNPQQIATAQARRAQNGGTFRLNRTPTPLIDAFIKLLQQKAGPENKDVGILK